MISAVSECTPTNVGDCKPKLLVGDADSVGLCVLERIAEALEQQAEQLRRIADHVNPPARDVVDSAYLARKLGCSTAWIAQMARRGEIPESCVVRGTGNGKAWKFYRMGIERWIETR
jgi:hypothetical protein